MTDLMVWLKFASLSKKLLKLPFSKMVFKYKKTTKPKPSSDAT
jgi:hypothetical protein